MESRWYANKKDFGKTLNQDLKIRDYLKKRLKDAAVASIIIERKKNRPEITINTAKPGVIIGRGGEDIDALRKELARVVGEEVYVLSLMFLRVLIYVHNLLQIILQCKLKIVHHSEVLKKELLEIL